MVADVLSVLAVLDDALAGFVGVLLACYLIGRVIHWFRTVFHPYRGE